MDNRRFDTLVRQIARTQNRRVLLGMVAGAAATMFASRRDVVANTTCVPDCKGKECGDDGCGSICGSCAPPNTCGGGGKPGRCGSGAGSRCKNKDEKKRAKKREANCSHRGDDLCLSHYPGDLATAAACAAEYEGCCELFGQCRGKAGSSCVLATRLDYGLF